MNKISFIDLKTQYSIIEKDIKNSISNVLESGQFILGPIVEKAELLLSKYTQAKNTITVSSGTDALFVSLLALNIGPGSKVFLPAFTYTATAEVIALLKATPVFVDVDDSTYNISPSDLDLKINSYKKSELENSAVIAVDLFGQPADYKRLKKITDAYDLHLISDAAQSFGGTIDNTKVGKLAPITTTSFYPTKPLSCYGDGGAIFTDNNDIAEKIKSIRSHGISNDPYENVRIGTNARFDAIQAAVIINK
ncbi:MAG: aminotransferase class I/II-fold pyridoxal phosphate-dependent enzyme, partial [Hyphomicrobiales bacterium]